MNLIVDTLGIGFSPEFQVDIELIHSRSGRSTFIGEENLNTTWKKFDISGLGIRSITNGKVNYDASYFNRLNPNLELHVQSEIYGLEADVSVPIPYPKTIISSVKSVEVNVPVSFEYLVKLSNGVVFEKKRPFFKASDLILGGDESLVLSNGILTYHSSSPITSPTVQLIVLNRLSKDTLCNTPLELKFVSSAVFDFSGEIGRAGANGTNGSIPGESGGNGAQGSAGQDGQNVEVYISKLSANDKDYLKVHVFGQAKDEFQLIELKPTTLIHILSNGGNGGRGGNGGMGKSAPDIVKTDRTSGTSTVVSSTGGNGGNGGAGGTAGKGGTVTIFLDESIADARPYLVIQNESGVAGAGGNGARGGSGETTDPSLLNLILNPNRGDRGRRGENGNSDSFGQVFPQKHLSTEEFKAAIHSKKRL